MLFYIIGFLFKNSSDGVHTAEHSMHWVGKVISVIYNIPLTNFVGYTPSLRDSDQSLILTGFEYINFKFFMGMHVFCRNKSIKNYINKVCDSPVSQVHGIVNEQKIIKNHTISVNDIQDSPNIDSDNKVLVFAGRLSPLKRPLKAIEIVNQLPSQYKIFILGSGPERKKCELLIEKLQLSNRAFLLGKQTHSRALQYISSSDGLILTSNAEAYPTVVFESLSYNRPVFATNVGIIEEIKDYRLHIIEDEPVRTINQNLIERQYTVDCEFLNRYSIHNYTSLILQSYKE